MTTGVKTSGGEGGIRTLGTGVSPYNGLANRRIRPLCHLSATISDSLPRCSWLPTEPFHGVRGLSLTGKRQRLYKPQIAGVAAVSVYLHSVLLFHELQQPKALRDMKAVAHGRLPCNLMTGRSRPLAPKEVDAQSVSGLGGMVVDSAIGNLHRTIPDVSRGVDPSRDLKC
jgi:hypothetical protein